MISSDSEARNFKHILDLFDTAERHIKRVEICRSEVPFPAINELRYAGHHLLKGLAADERGESKSAEKDFEDAKDHCYRAMYEASEAGIGYYLDLFKAFEGDYRDVSISEIVPDYVNMRKLAKRAQQKLVEGRLNRASPQEHTNGYMEVFGELRDAMDTLEESRGELNKVKTRQVKRHRQFLLTTFLVVAGLLLALARFIFC